MTENIVRILIADDHELIRTGIVSILKNHANYKVVGQAGTADEAIQLAIELKPDLIILDLGLPEKSGLEVIYNLQDEKITSKIIILTMHAQESLCKQALLAGAVAYVLKDFSAESLIDIIEKVEQGNIVVPENFQHLVKELKDSEDVTTSKKNGNDPLLKLSKREREIFFHIANGHPNRAIAKKLFISPRTVETHRARVIKKMGFNSSAELIKYAVKNNLL